jgi:hypothetical protein
MMVPNGEVPEPYFALANVHGICRLALVGAWREACTFQRLHLSLEQSLQLQPARFAEGFNRVMADRGIHVLPQLIEGSIRGSISVDHMVDDMLGFSNNLTGRP